MFWPFPDETLNNNKLRYRLRISVCLSGFESFTEARVSYFYSQGGHAHPAPTYYAWWRSPPMWCLARAVAAARGITPSHVAPPQNYCAPRRRETLPRSRSN